MTTTQQSRGILPPGAVADFSPRGLGTMECPAIAGRQMTLYVRARATDGQWRGTLLSRAAGDPHGRLLSCAALNPRHLGFREWRRIVEPTGIEFFWRTDPLESRVVPEYFADNSPFDWQVSRQHPDCRAGVLRVAAPVDLIGRHGWHDIVVRFDGPRLEMFVDGVLVDEEWPQGELRHFAGPFVVGGRFEDGKTVGDFGGDIETVAVWDHSLTDADIAQLSGGADAVARRREEIEGPQPASLQYWRPPGYNQYVGDCMPFYHDGVLHFFFLIDRRHHQSKWGTGAHQFAHLSTRNLIHWTHHPLALAITDQTEGSLGTGNCCYHDGVYYLYWIAHSRRLPFVDAVDHEDNIYVATSTDGIRFTKQPRPWLRLDYRTGGDINSIVFRDPNSPRHLMVIGGDAKRLAGIERFESDDLKTWRRSAALSSLGTLGVCPNYLQWNAWHYVAAGHTYWLTDDPAADQWRKAPNALDETLAVPMLVPFTGGRALLVGFRCYQDGYASAAVFREVIQRPDGTLVTTWVPEMIPPAGEPLSCAFRPIRGQIRQTGNAVRLDGGSACAMKVPHEAHISLRIAPDSRATGFGLGLRANADFTTGYDLRFVPERQAMEMRHAPDAAPRRPRTANNEPETIEGLDRPFDLDIIVKEDFLDIRIDNRLTKTHPLLVPGDELVLYSGQGMVAFDNVRVRPLNDMH